MGKSGDPRKQGTPEEGRSPEQLAAEMTQAFPPTLDAIATQVGAQAVPFPGFVGGKAVVLQIDSGPLQIRMHIHPSVVGEVCEELQAAKTNAESKVQAADLQTMKAELATNGAHA